MGIYTQKSEAVASARLTQILSNNANMVLNALFFARWLQLIVLTITSCLGDIFNSARMRFILMTPPTQDSSVGDKVRGWFL